MRPPSRSLGMMVPPAMASTCCHAHCARDTPCGQPTVPFQRRHGEIPSAWHRIQRCQAPPLSKGDGAGVSATRPCPACAHATDSGQAERNWWHEENSVIAQAGADCVGGGVEVRGLVRKSVNSAAVMRGSALGEGSLGGARSG
jgi:hypothetical protein